MESNGVRAAGLGEAGAALRRSEDFTPRLMELSPWRVQAQAGAAGRGAELGGPFLVNIFFWGSPGRGFGFCVHPPQNLEARSWAFLKMKQL